LGCQIFENAPGRFGRSAAAEAQASRRPARELTN